MRELRQTIQNTTCILKAQGTSGPIIYWPTHLHRGNEIEHLLEVLETLIPGQEFLLAAFLANDWNGDLSPWEAPAAFGADGFVGNAPATLQWLTGHFIPWTEQEAIPQLEFSPNGKRYMIGYSMAGLFSLWVAYETDLFDGIVCGSGSVWFPDWDTYVATHEIQRQSSIYLSLGGKEEKNKNQTMTLLGARTRAQEKVLKKDPMVDKSILEWNSGGHFSDSGKRLAKGIRWLLENR